MPVHTIEICGYLLHIAAFETYNGNGLVGIEKDGMSVPASEWDAILFRIGVKVI